MSEPDNQGGSRNPAELQRVFETTQAEQQREFERDKAAYDQNSEHLRSLNRFLWQVPLIATTLTGGLWYGVAQAGVVGQLRGPLLLFACVANAGLILIMIRVRYVFEQILQKAREFNPKATAETASGGFFYRERLVLYVFCALMALSALISLGGAIAPDKWFEQGYSRTKSADRTGGKGDNERLSDRESVNSLPSARGEGLFRTGFIALTTFNVLLLGGGVLLILIGKTRSARTIGLLSVVASFAHEFYVAKEFKIGSLVDLRQTIASNDPAMRIVVQEEMRRLGPIGPEYLGAVSHFRIGRATLDRDGFLSQEDLETANTALAQICSQWGKRRTTGYQAMLVVVGSTGRLSLNGVTRARYDANSGLARSRAEAVKEYLVSRCDGPPTEPRLNPRQVLTLDTGPRNTPTTSAQGEKQPPEGFMEDRRVDVWAFWSLGQGTDRARQ